jgi:hypothetical protein
MWFPFVDFASSQGQPLIPQNGDITTSPAQTGSNILEYGRLSELAVDVQYINNVYPTLRKITVGNGSLVAINQFYQQLTYPWYGGRSYISDHREDGR